MLMLYICWTVIWSSLNFKLSPFKFFFLFGIFLHFCLSSFLGKYLKGNLQHPPFMLKNTIVYTILYTPHRFIWIYIYFLQWASQSLRNWFIYSSLTSVWTCPIHRKFLFLYLVFPGQDGVLMPPGVWKIVELMKSVLPGFEQNFDNI